MDLRRQQQHVVLPISALSRPCICRGALARRVCEAEIARRRTDPVAANATMTPQRFCEMHLACFRGRTHSEHHWLRGAVRGATLHEHLEDGCEAHACLCRVRPCVLCGSSGGKSQRAGGVLVTECAAKPVCLCLTVHAKTKAVTAGLWKQQGEAVKLVLRCACRAVSVSCCGKNCALRIMRVSRVMPMLLFCCCLPHTR